MSLDVLTENQQAIRWYNRLGFEDQEHSEWWDLGPCSSLYRTGRYLGTGAGFVSGYPQASVSHREFGFSQFKVTTSEGDSIVGRLGENWFRVTRGEALADHAVFAALAALDPGRHVLAILPVGTLPKVVKRRARLIATMARKTVQLDLLTERLQGSG
jgi:hypothetical protein